MNVEQTVTATLANDTGVKALVNPSSTRVDNGVYPLQMSQPLVLPAVVYQRVANAPQNGVDGYHNLEQVRVQVDCWDKTYLGAKALAAAVRVAMMTTPLYGLFLMDLDGYDNETKLYRVTQDFSIWN